MKLHHNDESIMVSEWPKYDEKNNFVKEEADVELIKEIIKSIRNIRANMNVVPSRKASLIFVTDKKEVIEEGKGFIEKLAYADKISIQTDKTGIPENAVSLAVPGIEIYIPFNELVDIEAEIERLEKEKLTYQNEIKRVEKMLANEGFVSKAPAAKIEEEKAKKAKYEELLAKTEERLKAIQ